MNHVKALFKWLLKKLASCFEKNKTRDLRDVLQSLQGDPNWDRQRHEEEQKRNSLMHELELLKERIGRDPGSVSDAEILNGIRIQFDLNLTSDFLNGADWLMNALSFTHNPISTPQLHLAWGEFQAASNFAYNYWDYPILEVRSFWYFEHKDEPGRDELAMAARSAAVLEYLFAQIRGREASDEYRYILAGNGVTILSLYWVLKDYERVKFYANLLFLEYQAGRLGEEDYLTSLKFRDDCFSRGEDSSIMSPSNTELYTINESLIELLWNTWSDLELKNDQLAESNAKLCEELARRDSNKYPEPAREELSKVFGVAWGRLASETRAHLERAYTFLQEPYATHSPTASPDALFMAVKSELLARLFKPRGLLDEEILRRTRTTNPVKLLVDYGRRQIRTEQDRELVRSALYKAGIKSDLLTQHALRGLRRLVEDRNRIHHQASSGNQAYTRADLDRYIAEVWHSGWLVSFLRRVCESA